MKILLTATVQSHICQFHRPLVDILHEQGYEVHVAARDNLAEKNGLKLDFADKVFNIPFSRSPKSADNIKAYKQLKKIINDEKYDIIHCNTPMGGIVTRLAAIKARKNGTKVFYTAHGFHFYKGASKKNWLVFYPIEKFFSRLTDTLITITNEDYELASKKFHCDVYHTHGVGVNEERYHTATLNEQNDIRSELGFSNDDIILLCVGELLPNKNQKMAIRSMQRIVNEFPNARLLIAGNGPQEYSLKNEITGLGLSNNISLLGYCTNLEKYQQISTISLACSYREGLPVNVVEAMLSGHPVIASNNRGHNELIKNDYNGFIVKNEEDMAKAVIKLLQNSALMKSLSNNALSFASTYGSKNVKCELKEIYFKYIGDVI